MPLLRHFDFIAIVMLRLVAAVLLLNATGLLPAPSNEVRLVAAEGKSLETLVSSSKQPIIASGEVVSDKGLLVPGASVSLVGIGNEIDLAGSKIPSPWSTLLTATTTDQAGRFVIRRDAVPQEFLRTDRSERGSSPKVTVLIQASGWTPFWRKLRDTSALGRITLSRSSSIEGRLLNEQGLPLAGALVRAVAFKSHDVKQFEAEGEIDLVGLSIAPSTRTDSQGKFLLPQMPPKSLVKLLVGNNPNSAHLLLADMAQEPGLPEEKKRPSGAGSGQEEVHSRIFTSRVPAPWEIRGRVTFPDSGRHPIRARILLVPDQCSDRETGAVTRMETNESGEFRLTELYCREYSLVVIPPDGEVYPGYWLTAVQLTQPVSNLNIELARGIRVAGEVVDQNTGKGIPQVCVHANCTKSSSDNGEASRQWRFESVKTNAQGKFAITVPAGEGRVVISSAPTPYKIPEQGESDPEMLSADRYSRPYSSAKNGKQSGMRFELGRGVLVRGRVTTPDGKPVANAQVFEGRDDGSIDPQATTDVNGTYSLRVFDTQHRRVCVAHAGRKLITETCLSLPGSGGEREVTCNIVVQESASIKARILVRGKPAPGFRWMMEGAYPLNGQSIEFIPRTWFDTAHWTISFGKAATGLEKNPGLLKDGEVLIPGLPVLPKGGRYHIRFEDDGGEGHRVIIQDLKPGEVRNIGDVEIIQRIVPR